MPKPTRGLLVALEEMGALPENDTQALIGKDPQNPQADGKEVEMKNLAGKEGEEKNTSADTLPENNTQAIVQKDPEDPNSDGKVVELKVVETGKATESGIDPKVQASGEIAQEADGTPMPKNDTEGLVQPDPENPHSDGEVKEVTAVEKGKETESGIDPIEKTEGKEVAQESDGSPMPENNTQPVVAKNPEDPTANGDQKDMTLVEKGKATESGIDPIKTAMEELAEADEAIAQAEDVIGELERYRDIVEGSGDGDMNYVAAEILNQALENLRDHIGLTNSKKIPALEAHAGGIQLGRAKRAALEAISEDIQAISSKVEGAKKAQEVRKENLEKAKAEAEA